MKKYLIIISLLLSSCNNITQEDLNYSKIESNTIIQDEGSVIIESGIFTIKKPWTYKFTWKSDNWEIIIDVEENQKVELILDNVNIYNKTWSVIVSKNKTELTITLADNSKNILLDSELYSKENEKLWNATIYSKWNLIINWKWNLLIRWNFNDTITSKDNLTINSWNLTIISADDWIIWKDSVTINHWNINIYSKWDSIKSDKENEWTITINNWNINIVSWDDAIRWYKNITINNWNININKWYEWLESEFITINWGKTNINVIDDWINARYYNQKNPENKYKLNYLHINGGELYIESIKGDNIDIHGDVIMKWWYVYLSGSNEYTWETLDFTKKFNIAWWILLWSWHWRPARAPSDTSTQPVIYINFVDRNWDLESLKNKYIFTIKDSNNNIVWEIKPPNNFEYVFLSNQLLKLWETYSYYLDGLKKWEVKLEKNLTILWNTSKMNK